MTKAVSLANIATYESPDFLETYEHINLDVFNQRNQRRIHEIVKRLGTTSNGDFLDVGCGTGNILRHARKYFRNTYGIDYSAQALKRARYYTPNVVKADGRKLPFESNTFDCLSYYSVLHHLYDPQELFKEAYRVLKPRGVGYTDHDPNIFFCAKTRWAVKLYNVISGSRLKERDGQSLTEYHHMPGNELNPLLIKRQLENAGFRNVSVHYRPYDAAKLRFRWVLNLLFRLLAVSFPERHSCYYFYVFFEK